MEKHGLIITRNVSSFSDKRITIDAGMFISVLRLRARKHIAYKTDITNGIDEDEVDKIWIGYFIDELCKLMNYRITPILIFDGKAPPEKLKVSEERHNKRKAIEDEMEYIRDELASDDLFAPDKSKIARLRKLESTYLNVPGTSYERLRFLLRSIGIPTLQCYDGIEAERLASRLVVEGMAAAVFSADGDCLAHGAPVIIRRYGETKYDSEDRPTETFEVVIMKKVYKKLGINHKQFLDVCIMAKCDYNENIPGISFAKAYPLIKKHGSFKRLPKTFIETQKKKHKNCIKNLRYKTCIKMFSPLESEDMFDWKDELFQLDLDEDNAIQLFMIRYDKTYLKKNLEDENVDDRYSSLIKAYNRVYQSPLYADSPYRSKHEVKDTSNPLVNKIKNMAEGDEFFDHFSSVGRHNIHEYGLSV